MPIAALKHRAKPLIEEATVSTAGSATLLYRSLQKSKATLPVQIAGFAPAQDLPFSKLELARIQNMDVDETDIFAVPMDALHLAGHVQNNNRAWFELGNDQTLSSWDILGSE